jgi:hypothetical protein
MTCMCGALDCRWCGPAQAPDGRLVRKPVIARIHVGLVVHSQNVTDRLHWAQRAKLKKMWTNWLLRLTSNVPRPATGKRAVTILSYRRRRITDHANLVGGAKLVIDAIRDAGLIVDDSDQWMIASYGQELARLSPDGRESTVVIIESSTTMETP